MTRCVVTGGGGFIGAFLAREMVARGWDTVVVDNLARGDQRRLEPVIDQIEFHQLDVRDEDGLIPIVRGADVVMHLAAINGTENFYKHPELVLDVGLRGCIAVMNACRASQVPDVVVASSAEVYQTPPSVPTPEDVPLMLPNSLNPRYSYGGSKLISELIAFNYGKDVFRKVQVFRPHNVYGPDMGWKHVVPQFIQRIHALKRAGSSNTLEIQGKGTETRAFAYVDDVVSGIIQMYERGGHRDIYHIGNDEEVTVAELAHLAAEAVGIDIQIKQGKEAEGGTPRRCPDISKMRALGYDPQVSLREGIARTAEWYVGNADLVPASELL